jgi:hypothetical protein
MRLYFWFFYLTLVSCINADTAWSGRIVSHCASLEQLLLLDQVLQESTTAYLVKMPVNPHLSPSKYQNVNLQVLKTIYGKPRKKFYR